MSEDVLARGHLHANRNRRAKEADWPDKAIRPAGDAEVVLWYCPNCGQSGALVTDHQANAEMVARGLEQAHKLASPTCSSGVCRIRIVRPNGWANTASEVLTNTGTGPEADRLAPPPLFGSSSRYVN